MNHFTKIYIRVPLYFLLIIAFWGCEHKKSTSSEKTIITFWHFWSEPSQKMALQTIIEEFEQQNPTIDIQTTELQWSDGKAKLAMAIQAQKAPDVMHIGLEWVQEFAQAKVLHNFPSHDTRFPALTSALSHNNTPIAMGWLVNTRAIILDTVLHCDSLKTWATFSSYIQKYAQKHPQKYAIGIHADEPLNISKKTLPWLWSAGSSIFRTYPISESFDKKALDGLRYYLQLSHYGLMEKSRVLDEQFTQHSLHSVLTGMWIIANPMIENNTHKYTVLPTIPTAENTIQGASILSADCLSIAAQSQCKKQAETFVRFLTEYRNSKRFSIAVPDAGFPADTAIINDNELQSNPLRKGFLQQTLYSAPIIASPITAEAISLFEKEIMYAFYQKKTPEQALADAKKEIQLLEERISQRK